MRIIAVRLIESQEMVGLFQVPNQYKDLVNVVDEACDPSECEWTEIEGAFLGVFLNRVESGDPCMDHVPQYEADTLSQKNIMVLLDLVQNASEKWHRLCAPDEWSEIAMGGEIVEPVVFFGDSDYISEELEDSTAKQEAAKLFKQLSRSMDQKYGRHLSALETLFDGDLDSNIPGVPF